MWYFIEICLLPKENNSFKKLIIENLQSVEIYFLRKFLSFNDYADFNISLSGTSVCWNGGVSYWQKLDKKVVYS